MFSPGTRQVEVCSRQVPGWWMYVLARYLAGGGMFSPGIGRWRYVLARYLAGGGMFSPGIWQVEVCSHQVPGWWMDVLARYVAGGGMFSPGTWQVEVCSRQVPVSNLIHYDGLVIYTYIYIYIYVFTITEYGYTKFNCGQFLFVLLSIFSNCIFLRELHMLAKANVHT